MSLAKRIILGCLLGYIALLLLAILFALIYRLNNMLALCLAAFVLLAAAPLLVRVFHAGKVAGRITYICVATVACALIVLGVMKAGAESKLESGAAARFSGIIGNEPLRSVLQYREKSFSTKSSGKPGPADRVILYDLNENRFLGRSYGIKYYAKTAEEITLIAFFKTDRVYKGRVVTVQKGNTVGDVYKEYLHIHVIDAAGGGLIAYAVLSSELVPGVKNRDIKMHIGSMDTADYINGLFEGKK